MDNYSYPIKRCICARCGKKFGCIIPVDFCEKCNRIMRRRRLWPNILSVKKVKEVIKNFGIGAIEDGQYTLDSVDDIWLLASAIDLIPPVDAAEVVRCKNCKYWHKDIGWCDINSHFVDDNDAPCSYEESPNWRVFAENDFCSYGERKVSE